MSQKETSDIWDDEKDVLLNHEYDGIRELDNHMPRWWILGFYFTIAFAVVYMAYYHVLGGPSDVDEYNAEMAAAAATAVPAHQTGPAMDYSTLVALTDEESLAQGKTIYGTICHVCHGAGGEGLVGPNLTDAYSVHGCDLTSLITSTKTGFPELGMPPYGGGAVLSDEQLHLVSSYILSLSGSNPANAKPIDPSREIACPS